MASTYMLRPHTGTRVSCNFRGSEVWSEVRSSGKDLEVFGGEC